MDQGLQQLENFGGDLTPQQQTAVDRIRPFLRGERDWSEFDVEGEADEAGDAPASEGGDASDAGAAEPSDDGGANVGGFGQGLVRVESEPARQAAEGDEDGPSARGQMISYYAAGIGVMFLLFSMAGAGGSILEEEERGTLERILASNVGMWTILGSNWLFFSLLGFAQMTVMFLWAWIIFDLPLFDPHHLTGFIVMSTFTAVAAAAFGMLLATICRSHAQLSGMSTVIILIMSALGGSMVPRVVAPDVFDITSIFTFNGWALDGYLRVFWYAQPDESIPSLLVGLAGPLAMLAGMAIVFILVARRLAKRWETV
jgi:ABC-2 type transport system permease protein